MLFSDLRSLREAGREQQLHLFVTLWFKGLVPRLKLHTNEIHRLVQPWQNFLTKAVVHGDSKEVRFGYEVRLWAGIAGI